MLTNRIRCVPFCSNADECLRLAQLGLSDSAIRHFGHSTRCLGCFPRKGAYSDYELLSGALDEPVIARPEITGGIALDGSCRLLIIMSAGVYSSLEDASNTDQVLY